MGIDDDEYLRYSINDITRKEELKEKTKKTKRFVSGLLLTTGVALIGIPTASYFYNNYFCSEHIEELSEKDGFTRENAITACDLDINIPTFRSKIKLRTDEEFQYKTIWFGLFDGDVVNYKSTTGFQFLGHLKTFQKVYPYKLEDLVNEN